MSCCALLQYLIRYESRGFPAHQESDQLAQQAEEQRRRTGNSGSHDTCSFETISSILFGVDSAQSTPLNSYGPNSMIRLCSCGSLWRRNRTRSL